MKLLTDFDQSGTDPQLCRSIIGKKILPCMIGM